MSFAQASHLRGCAAARPFVAATLASRKISPSTQIRAERQGGGGGSGRRSLLQSLLTGGVMLAAGFPGARSVAAAAAADDKSAQVLLDPRWPEEFPFKPEYFQRCDTRDDQLACLHHMQGNVEAPPVPPMPAVSHVPPLLPHMHGTGMTSQATATSTRSPAS